MRSTTSALRSVVAGENPLEFCRALADLIRAHVGHPHRDRGGAGLWRQQTMSTKGACEVARCTIATSASTKGACEIGPDDVAPRG